MSLPSKTSADDVTTVVSYLKRKATGATLAEMKAALQSKFIDGRKLTAYETWGFVTKEGDKLKLTPSGRELSRASGQQKSSIFAGVVARIKPYSMAIEWAFHQGFDQVDSSEVAAHWYEHCPEELGTAKENAIRDQVVCFFNLAQAASLGTYHLGRRGQATRLELSQDTLAQFVEDGEKYGSYETDGDEAEPEASEHDGDAAENSADQNGTQDLSGKQSKTSTDGGGNPTTNGISRVFISHSENKNIVDQIKTMLELADLNYEIAVEEETTAIPVPEKVLSAMRRCTAAAICVTADERSRKDDGSYSISENVLIEIGSAFVLYDKKVVLVWDRRLTVPSNLQGLYRCEFEGNELSWSAGMKLMKAVNNFKK